ncbi:hypothetical protein DAPPUDRAFT_116789 [Daphnia pulex]|uniref:Uncharacterized protein n=1 Tax=Daphnia pulex TaxID=6669 RepID=E9HQI5_DAPPU|nr:hypothetical protein DAPPUDRAFT_116789 [Daphnia pulex]|eukprot:EFX66004.1 hypothetical protein DAPPUDRAFT_116789 [Daphnia pulex]
MGNPRYDPFRRHYKKDTRFLLDLYTLTYDSGESLCTVDCRVGGSHGPNSKSQAFVSKNFKVFQKSAIRKSTLSGSECIEKSGDFCAHVERVNKELLYVRLGNHFLFLFHALVSINTLDQVDGTRAYISTLLARAGCLSGFLPSRMAQVEGEEVNEAHFNENIDIYDDPSFTHQGVVLLLTT